MSNYNPNHVLIHGGWLGDYFFIWGEQKQHKKYKDYLNFQYPFLYSPFELKLTLFQDDANSFYGTFVQTKKASLIAPIQERMFYSEVGETLVYQANTTSTEFVFPLEGIVIQKKELPKYIESMKRWNQLPKIKLAYDFNYWLTIFSTIQTEIKNGNLILTSSGAWELAKWNWTDWEETLPKVSFSFIEPRLHHISNDERENYSFRKMASEICSQFVQYLIAKDMEVQKAFEELHHSKYYLLNDIPDQEADDKLFLEELGAIPAVPFQTTIAIEEPNQNEDEWKILLFLQDRNDPSIIVSLEDLHRGHHPWRVNPVTRLKEDIAEIIQLIPELSSLSITRPISLVTKEVVYDLLTYHFEHLRRLGIGVVVPNWLKKRPNHFQANIQVTDQSAESSSDSESMFNWQTISEFNFEIVLNGEKLTHEQFTKLVNLKTPFIKWNGKWLYWDPNEAKHLTKYLNQKKEQQTSLLDTWKTYLLDDIKESDGLDVSIQWDEKLLSAIEATLNKEIASITPPASLKGELRPYQIEGVSWLFHMRRVGFGACLADDMGLGKSIQTIAYMLAVIESQTGTRTTPFLIICPTSLIGNWQEELQRFAPHLSVFVHHGVERLADAGDRDWPYDIVITSYALAFRDELIFSNTVWNGLILDEAQQIKNVETKQRKAIKLISASHRIALTGTPIENRLKELWSIMDMLNDRYLGQYQQFQRAFVKEIEGSHPNEKKLQQLRILISPFLLRRKKSDKALELQLPDKTEQTYVVGLTAEQASLYQAVVNELLASIDEKNSIERRATILSSITKLKQICNHPSQFLKDRGGLHHRSEKWDLLFTLVEQIIDNEEKLLIFTQYKEMGQLLQLGLSEYFKVDVPFLHGGLARHERDEVINKFKEDASTPIFILSLRAGGVGLNLTAANHVIHYDRWWNPAVENQATDRAYRIGQTEKVTVHKLVSKGTIEEKIDRLLIKKQSLSDDILSLNEKSVSELTTDELKSLLEWSDQK
ncbi:DEAD/DEAH box helicase [Alkalihalobacillus sp. BA299]|uniref:DEAD/DEAH box helicase n=1 Tax=Alkalihalobacillus sp. BA299 TaxID=2815938 RepID=UPI001ADB3418|nr:DEAD/DEAH box helicase [Alkalihalobacillus sp. BA299]